MADSTRIDSLIKVIEKASKFVSVVDAKGDIQALFVMFNIFCFCAVVFVCYCIVTIPGFRANLWRMMTNDDGRAEHRDGDKILIWCSALGFFWLSVDTIILALYYGPDSTWYFVIGLELGGLGGLLGINLKKIKTRS